MPTVFSRGRQAAVPGSLIRRVAIISPAVLSLVGAVYIALVAIDSRPISDDLFFASIARHADAWSTLHTYWHDLTDRFSTLLLTMVSLKAFGLSAVNVVPLVILVLLWLVLAQSARKLALLNERSLSRAESLCLGLLASIAVVATAPSLFDTVGWFTSNVSYLVGFTAAIALALCLAAIAERGGNTASACVLAAILGLLLAGFHELIGTTVVLAAPIAALTRQRGGDRSARGRRASVVLAAAGGGALVGVVIDMIGPGTRARDAAQHAHVGVGNAFRAVTHSASFVYGDLRSGTIALTVASGLVGWQLIGAPRSPVARRNLLLSAAFLIIVPWLVTSTMTACGRSLEAGDRPPFRAAFLITGSVALGLMLLIPLILDRLPARLGPAQGSMLALLLVAGGLLGLSRDAAPIIRAERMRATLVASRAESIRAAVADGESTITVAPAPLLTVDTQAFDLPYDGARHGDWNLPVLRSYFKVSHQIRLKVASRQPAGYCLPGVTVSWIGVRSCAQLSASGRTPS